MATRRGVQVFNPGPSTGAQVGAGLGQGISSGLEMLMQDKVQKMHERKRGDALEAAGIPRGLAALDPTILKEFAKTHAQQQAIQGLFGGGSVPLAPQSKAALQQDNTLPLEKSESKAALHSSEGAPLERGPTRLKKMTDEQLQVLQGFPAFKDIAKSELEMRSAGKKESTQLEANRYKANLPIYKADQKKMEGLEKENLNLKRINVLNESGKLPSGVGRWNVDFDMGELRVPFASNEETEEFVKLINDWTVNAKESFGARVTNFELKRFMKRLPSLLNTEGGRRRIIRNMEIINEINGLNKSGIQNAFDKAGGLRKLDYDQAQRIAKRENKVRVNELKKEYVSGKKAVPKKEIAKSVIPQGNIEIISPDGKRGHIPKSQLKAAMKAGYKRGS